MKRKAGTLYPGLVAATAGLVTLTLLASEDVSALPSPRPPYFTAWENTYPNSQSGNNVLGGTGSSCQFCHEQVNGGNGWNAYGWELRELVNAGNNIDQALLLAEPFDSDLDPSGATNLQEIDGDTQPGWTDGPNNTIYFSDGSTLTNQTAPAAIQGDLDPSLEPGAGYCFGDSGSGTACPCSNDNDGSVPGSGCANGSFASGAKLVGSGEASVSADTLVLSASGLHPSNTGLYFQANNAVNGGDGVVFGDGLRCAGGGLIRLQVRTSDATGTSSTTIAISVKGGVSPGDTKRYQCWYRDNSGNQPCGVGVNDFNLSNGYEITWLP